jgi:hypothetical protein
MCRGRRLRELALAPACTMKVVPCICIFTSIQLTMMTRDKESRLSIFDRPNDARWVSSDEDIRRHVLRDD